EGDRIIKAFQGVRSFDRSGRNDRFTVALERGTNKIKAFEYEVSPLEIYQARTGDDGLLRAERLDMKVSEQEIAEAFVVGPNVTESIIAAGLDPAILGVLDTALAGRVASSS